jgi:hypothetical protein
MTVQRSLASGRYLTVRTGTESRLRTAASKVLRDTGRSKMSFSREADTGRLVSKEKSTKTKK